MEYSLVRLKRVEPDVGVKSLGVLNQLDSKETHEIEYLVDKLQTWDDMIKHIPLPPSMNLNALLTMITKTVIYPLPITNFIRAQCREIEGKLYQHSLPKCGISSKYPFVMRYSPTCYMGIAIPEFYNQQGTLNIFELLKHYKKPTTSGKQLYLQFELASLNLGSGK